MWRIKRNNEPPLASYFIAYIDEFEDPAARGHMGDIAILRPCAPPPETYPSPPQPPPGAPPVRHGGPGTPPIPPPGTPPGVGCLPNQLRDANSGQCVPGCSRPNIQINGKCCSVTSIAANAACSNSNCPSGQTPIGPSNFCCNSSQVYTGAGGAQKCCPTALVNRQCQPPTKPPVSNCPPGYVQSGAACCLASQMTSTGICCPKGQAPAGPNKSQCLVVIHIPSGPSCSCGAGLILTASGKCCAPGNVTAGGVCCSGPVDPNNRASCPLAQPIPACAKGYTRMPDGTCCNDRFISDDGMSCKGPQTPCSKGEFRDSSGACVPVAPLSPCAPGTVPDSNGNCISGGGPVPPPRECPPGEVRDRAGACVPERRLGCPPGRVLNARGNCVPVGAPPGRRLPPPRFVPPPRQIGPTPGAGATAIR